MRKITLLGFFAICFGVFPVLAAEKSLPAEIKSFTFRAPPNFGYFIGDVVEHRIDVTIVKPYTLSIEHLPKPGPRTRWINVKSIDVDNRLSSNGNHYSIIATYQLFRGVKKTTDLLIPSMPLKFTSKERSFKFTSPAWSYSIAALIPDNLRDDEVDIAPAVKPELVPVKTHLRPIIAGIIFLLGYLAWFYGWLPFLPKRGGPFARAFREIRKSSRGNLKPDTYETALKSIHRAINQTVGATVFADQLADYCLKYPLLAESENGFRTFFQISRGVFFDNNPAKYRQEYPLTWLESFCQDLSRLEKRIL